MTVWPSTLTRWLLALTAILHAVAWAFLTNNPEDPSSSFLFVLIAALAVEVAWLGVLVRRVSGAGDEDVIGSLLGLTARHLVPLPAERDQAIPFGVALVALGATLAYGIEVLL